MVNWTVDKYTKALENKSEGYWLREGGKMALKLFRLASRKVPAYKKFLKRHHIDPDKITTIEEFKKVPVIDKKNYLRFYDFPELCWNGNPGAMDMISVSSGSTGKPFYWLRGEQQEREAALTLESFYCDAFNIDRRSTLFIISFAMGVWIGGTLIHRCSQAIANKYNMTVVTPGINIPEIFKIIKTLGKHYEQVIIAGYPPFVKDIIDQGKENRIGWKNYHIKFLFAAEAFSERWRNYLFQKVGAKDVLRDSVNIYGTADAVIMAHETPLSNMIRRIISQERPEIYRKIFWHDERVPTLAQFNPAFKFTEVENGRLIFSSFSGIPLVRYDLGDRGGVIKFSEMKAILAEAGVDLEKEAKKRKINLWKIPFVYVFGRSDFTASLYGLNIYPETIRDGLSTAEAAKHVSGKFTMFTKNDEQLNQFLEINVELKNGVKPAANLAVTIKSSIVGFLKSRNAEYNELHKTMGSQVEPKVSLLNYGHKDYFGPGIKQKWRKT